MSEKSTPKTSAKADLASGQSVIVTARWILVLAGLVLTLWNPPAIGRLRIQILVILLLAFANFYLQAELLRKRPTVEAVAYGASVGDLFVITLIIIAQGGFDANTYVFYFPAILAYSVAFPTAATFVLTGATLTAYLFVAVATIVSVRSSAGITDVQILIARMVMFAAVAFCGNLYQRIERDRRQEAAEAQELLLERIQERGSEEVVVRKKPA